MSGTADPRTEPLKNADPLSPAAGLLVGLGLSLPLWLVVGGLLWLGRAQVKPVVGTVLAWALAFVHVS